MILDKKDSRYAPKDMLHSYYMRAVSAAYKFLIHSLYFIGMDLKIPT